MKAALKSEYDETNKCPCRLPAIPRGGFELLPREGERDAKSSDYCLYAEGIPPGTGE